MRVYHGTITKFADEIKRDGLQARSDRQMNIKLETLWGWSTSTVQTEQPKPHVTTDLAVAEDYARYRANYERAAYGAALPGTLCLSNGIKLGHDIIADALPCVVEFEIPYSWESREDVHDSRGLVVAPIPAKFVAGVLPVKMYDEKTEQFIKQRRDDFDRQVAEFGRKELGIPDLTLEKLRKMPEVLDLISVAA